MNKKNNALRIAVGAILSGGVLIASAPAYSCASDPFIGSICVTAANFCPYPNYSLAQGQTIAISSNQALFSLIGCNYGGDCRTTFKLPDLRGISPVGIGNAPGMSLGIPNLGGMRGTETTTLNVNQMPQHSHTATAGAPAVAASTNPATKPVAAGGDLIASNEERGGAPRFIPSADAGTTVNLGGVSGGAVQVANTGGSQPFANFPPQLGINYCIAVQGIFPSRP